MKLKNKYFVLLFITTIGFISCDTDKFLDEPVPTDSVTSIAAYGSINGIEAAMTGTYNVLRDFFASHDTAGNRAYYLGGDVMGTDVTCPDFNWYIFETRWDVVDSANGRRVNWAWDMYYSTANACRTHKEGIAASSAISDAEKEAYIAELDALEAHCYFNLVRYYSPSYLGGSSQPGIPTYTDSQGVSNVGNPRLTMQDTYDYILVLLNRAIPNLPNARNAKYRMNKSVAQGVLARVYLEIGEWDLAAQTANAAKAGFPLMDATTYQAGFNELSNAEWMWGMPYNAEQDFGFARFFSFIDHFSAGYNDLYIGTDFQATFTSATDVRRNLILLNSFTDPYKRYITNKFQDKADQSGDNIMMRSSEMWMIEAEALAYSNLPAAKVALLQVLSARDSGATLSTAATAADFVDEVLDERRKEFYGELGLGYFDLKRYNKGLDRTGPNQRWQLTVPAGDTRWAFYLPQSEIDKNDNISESDQN